LLVRVTFIPTIPEHFRATAELRRVARVFDPAAALPYFLAALLLARGMTQAAWGMGTPGIEDVLFGAMPVLFLVGIGIGARQGLGREVSFDFGAEEIEIAQPRRRWSVPWAQVARVEETAEFFLVATPGAAFYIPRRALDGRDTEAALRDVLAARGARAEG
jgi:hypothetical protein